MAAEMELRDDMRARLTHGNWTSLFRNGGRISEEGQRKRLLGLIRKNPRDYRGIYARVMEAPELAVSAEDAQAAALMYELADTKRENIQGFLDAARLFGYGDGDGKAAFRFKIKLIAGFCYVNFFHVRLRNNPIGVAAD
jgi:hypothetical protein